jgi:hypothetical protein
MALDKGNRALRRVVELLDGDDNIALMWCNEHGAPVLIIVIDSHEEPSHTVTLAVRETREGGGPDEPPTTRFG